MLTISSLRCYLNSAVKLVVLYVAALISVILVDSVKKVN